MDSLIWASQAAVPLLGWWILLGQFQKLGESFQKNWKWNESFESDFFKSLALSFCHATPEKHLQSIRFLKVSERVKLVQIGLRSLSLGFIFILVFWIWNWIPSTVFLLLGLTLFLISRWWKPAQSFAIFMLGLGVFVFGFENLLQVTSQTVRSSEPSNWIYAIARNDYSGVLIGLGLGLVIRLLTRMSGVAWWMSANLLLAGVLSLPAAWGFVLGDFLMGLLEDFYHYREKDVRIRLSHGIGFALVMLILTAPFLQFVTSWINGQYSVQLRTSQLASMVFVFLFLESSLALGFLHFYFHRKKVN